MEIPPEDCRSFFNHNAACTELWRANIFLPEIASEPLVQNSDVFLRGTNYETKRTANHSRYYRNLPIIAGGR